MVLTVMAAWCSILWIDKPLALWIYEMFGERHIAAELADSPISSVSLISTCLFIACGLSAIMSRRFSKSGVACALCAISTLAAILIKDELKFAFGRTWPDSWGPGILSLVRNGVYGFHFFHSGRSFESFPSGHATVAAAVLSVPWILFSRMRAVCAICIVGVDIALVALNLHFLSDVIAGTFIGCSTGLFTVALWRASPVDVPS